MSFMMNPREKIYMFYFQNGHSFPDEIVMRDTLRAEFMGHEIYVPGDSDMVPVFTSIVLTYNNKFKEQEKIFQKQLQELYINIFALQSQRNALTGHSGRLQMLCEEGLWVVLWEVLCGRCCWMCTMCTSMCAWNVPLEVKLRLLSRF